MSMMIKMKRKQMKLYRVGKRVFTANAVRPDLRVTTCLIQNPEAKHMNNANQV